MITTVTLNPAIDKTIILDNVDLGQVHRIKKVIETVGGKGINVSKVLNFFNADSVAFGVFGRDNLEFFLHYLNNNGIKHSYIEVDGTTRTNVKMIETKHQRTTDLNEPGIELTKYDVDKITTQIVDISKTSDYVVLSGSLPVGVNDKYYAEVISEIKQNTKVVLDAYGATLKFGVEAGADIIKPNKQELEQAFDVCLNSIGECIDFCLKLIRNNRLDTVLLTLGQSGALHITKKDIFKSKPINVNVENTVGAGDSFLGGYLAGKARALSDKEAFKIAITCGTLAVMQKGTDIFKASEFDNMIKKAHVFEYE